MIKKSQEMFLQAIKASLNNVSVDWTENLEQQEWAELFYMAEQHHVLPMFFEAVYNSPAAKQMDPQLFLGIKRKTVQMVTLQTMKTSEFLQLYQALKGAGVTACVVKGIICRALYPKPDYRMSGDEDLLISPEQFDLCHSALTDFGMQPSDPGKDIFADYEISYKKPGSPIYIELHKSLFPPDSEAYGELGRYFENAMDSLIEISIQGCDISTLEPTDHLFYLICHAFKHFLHSGFGIRQVCDIALFANRYGESIDWGRVLTGCREIHAELFAAAIFRIGEKYLGVVQEKTWYPQEWQKIQINEVPMLVDLLDSGIYGYSSMSRRHSSNMTLSAVSAQKRGKRNTNGVMETLFPSAQALEGRFIYLRRHPYLLPVAWIDRILRYRRELQRLSNNDAAESIKIGNQRTELLKMYGIIKK